MKIITLEKLAQITGFSEGTLRTWLSGYKFSAYRLAHDYRYSEGFIQTLVDYLESKGYFKPASKLRDYVFQTPVC